MNYYFHVPEGRTARLTKQGALRGVEGLYTDSFIHAFNFRTSILVLLINEEKISLTHADPRTPTDAIEREIAWVGKECEKILIYDKTLVPFYEEICSGQMAEEDYGNFSRYIFSPHSSSSNKGWLRKPILQVYGISLSFNSNTESTLHKRVGTFSKEGPPLLLKHPQEKLFLAVHKIEESICFNADYYPKKQNLIFNEDKWVTLPEAELTVFHINPIALKIDLDFIKAGGAYFTDEMFHRIRAVRRDIMSTRKGIYDFEQDLEFCEGMAKYFQDYFFKDSPDKLLLNDLDKTLSVYRAKNQTDKSYPPMSTEKDKEVESSLLSIVRSQSDIFAQVEKVISDYKKTEPLEAAPSSFKFYILRQVDRFVTNYKERCDYAENEKRLKEWAERKSSQGYSPQEILQMSKENIGLALRQASADPKVAPDLNYKKMIQSTIGGKVLTGQSTNGNTAMHWALIKGQFEKFKLLCEAVKAFSEAELVEILEVRNREGKTATELFASIKEKIPAHLSNAIEKLLPLNVEQEISTLKLSKPS